MSALGGRLTALRVKHARKPGMLADGNGLCLQVTRANARSWIFRYYRNGKSREMGLGSLNAVSLANARLKAAACRGLLADGIDPIAARNAERTQRALEDARAITFDQCADAFITAHSATWKNQKHIAQWKATLRTYVSPVCGSLPVQVVDVALIIKVLEPIWTTKPETAARIRGRIESVLNWAKARGYRTGENPALWKGHLSNLLPAHSKIAKVLRQPSKPIKQRPEVKSGSVARSGVCASVDVNSNTPPGPKAWSIPNVSQAPLETVRHSSKRPTVMFLIIICPSFPPTTVGDTVAKPISKLVIAPRESVAI
jgi:hypothetical protein